jgi:SAM-dependent methyltransferase
VGCGTGTLVLMARQQYPTVTVVGVDGDPTILGIARRKARRAGIAIQLDEGMAYALPYPDGSFDAVVSTLMFHHLNSDQQARTLAEVRRVLRPRGRLVIADLDRPHNHLMRVVRHFPLLHRRRHGRHGGRDHARGPADRMLGLDALLAAGAWQAVAPTEHFMSMLGTVALRTLLRPE